MDKYYNLIKEQYLNSQGDSTQLFQTILAAAQEIGFDRALETLEQCVTEKRLAWLNSHLENIDPTDSPINHAYHLFYEVYLGVTVPEDGEIVERTGNRIVMRWWNACPTLTACQKLGLDTRQVCSKAYHQPVQKFLSLIHPRLKFDRNYQALRPYQAYCEEIITLEE